jgi:hypothetical protein
MAHPRGESGSDAVRLDFDRRLMLQFRGSLVTCWVAGLSRVRRSMSCIQEQPTEGVCPNAREKWPDQTLDQAFGLPEVLVAVGTSRLSCKRAGKREH